ncbi:hypothetical protein HYH03_013929 [Edaphochlamys debaryana]|uniref:Uncharacterized protein n=1 Tax=Edaphochlamys debaryana TaxID=47281 RepID=A0A836BSI0_9CHLO|nr:hypothetical protein HYH03_013929 [Edaphochlamys debaryana]|eukprot:KAG2487511.1 hypothetical protein HYH03_013929 [Edaphochlamys debaryana]
MLRKLTGLGQKPEERPRLALCSECGGKGQESYFAGDQSKKWGGCGQCAQGRDLPYGGLGVMLKCHCQDSACTYEFIRAADVQYFKGFDKHDAHALKKFQAELGDEGNALLLICDGCSARYLIQDMGGRRRITAAASEADKQHNRDIASELAGRGIAKILRVSPKAPAAFRAELAKREAEKAAALLGEGGGRGEGRSGGGRGAGRVSWDRGAEEAAIIK